MKKLLERFIEMDCKKTNQKEFDTKSNWKKEMSYMSNGKDMIIHLIAGLIKIMLHKNE